MGVMLLSMSGELLFNDEVALVFSMALAMIHGPVAPGIGQGALLLLREAGDNSQRIVGAAPAATGGRSARVAHPFFSCVPISSLVSLRNVYSGTSRFSGAGTFL